MMSGDRTHMCCHVNIGLRMHVGRIFRGLCMRPSATCAAYKQAADDFCPQQQSTTDLYHESCWGVVSSALAAKLEILTYRMLLAF